MPPAVRLGGHMTGLPPTGVAASLEAITFAEPEIQNGLMRSERAIFPEDRWPARILRARAHVDSHEDWDEVGGHLTKQGVVAPGTIERAFTVRRRPALNGAVAREKKVGRGLHRSGSAG